MYICMCVNRAKSLKIICLPYLRWSETFIFDCVALFVKIAWHEGGGIVRSRLLASLIQGPEFSRQR